MIYVDETKNYPRLLIKPGARHAGLRWAHLWTDPGNETELHVFAAMIGMKREWFQNRAGFPHYDVVPARRELALAKGAVPMVLSDWVKNKQQAKGTK